MDIRMNLIAMTMLAAACSGPKEKADAVPAEQTDGEYQEAMAKEHAKDSTHASGAEAQQDGDREAVGAMIEYGKLGEQPLNGYLAKPTSGEVRGGIIVIHEWWGLNDNIKAMADKLATHGYMALAVDMYGGKAGATPEEAKALMTAAMENPQAGVQNLELASTYLGSQNAGKLGVIGWCFGGAWSLQAGLTQPDSLAAVVMYYGRVKTTKEEIAALNAPLLGIFASEDKGIPVDQVKAFESALEEGGKDAKIHVYDGVDHAFANPTGDRYAPDAAKDAWMKTLVFFEANLAN